MEDQKKTESNGAQKHHKPRRRHGYFIEPPTQNGEQAPDKKAENGKPQRAEEKQKPKSEQARAAEARPSEQSSGEARQDGNARSSKNKRPHKNRHRQKPSQPKPEQQNVAPAQTEEKKPEGERPQHSNQNKKKHHQEKRASIPFTPAPKPAVPTHSSEDYEEYRLTVDEVASESKSAEATEEAIEMTEVVGIRFKSTGKVYYFDPNGKQYAKGTSAIVDTARGLEFGEVAMPNGMVKSSDIVPPLRQVIRSATKEDIAHHKANKQKEEEAFKICTDKIATHGLDMKLIDAQYTFDNTKLLFYFTSSDRVDFRNLVKDLASVFRTRIELRQIGIRDEAKLMGGLGMCGRPLCCTLFLSDFDQVSIKMAKEQNLSLNSAKISGICGRLMCCLKYEHEAYEYEIKRTPPVDSLVRTENGDGVVTEINPLRRTIKVRLLASPEVPPKTYDRDQVTMLRKKSVNEDKQ